MRHHVNKADRSLAVSFLLLMLGMNLLLLPDGLKGLNRKQKLRCFAAEARGFSEREEPQTAMALNISLAVSSSAFFSHSSRIGSASVKAHSRAA